MPFSTGLPPPETPPPQPLEPGSFLAPSRAARIASEAGGLLSPPLRDASGMAEGGGAGGGGGREEEEESGFDTADDALGESAATHSGGFGGSGESSGRECTESDRLGLVGSRARALEEERAHDVVQGDGEEEEEIYGSATSNSFVSPAELEQEAHVEDASATLVADVATLAAAEVDGEGGRNKREQAPREEETAPPRRICRVGEDIGERHPAPHNGAVGSHGREGAVHVTISQGVEFITANGREGRQEEPTARGERVRLGAEASSPHATPRSSSSSSSYRMPASGVTMPAWSSAHGTGAKLGTFVLRGSPPGGGRRRVSFPGARQISDLDVSLL